MPDPNICQLRQAHVATRVLIFRLDPVAVNEGATYSREVGEGHDIPVAGDLPRQALSSAVQPSRRFAAHQSSARRDVENKESKPTYRPCGLAGPLQFADQQFC